MTETRKFSDVTTYLQQGDIFKIDVVCPIIDTEQRLFRSVDGRHGSVVFSGSSPGKVFEPRDLLKTLEERVQTPLHTKPYCLTPDGHPELVVVHATKTSHFIVASQTCDISGCDKKALDTCIILPIRTILEVCRNERLPFDNEGSNYTIEEYVDSVCGSDLKMRDVDDPLSYPDRLRELMDSWNPATKAKNEEKSRIKNYLKKLCESNWTYYLQPDSELQIPASFVDLAVAYTVPVLKLEQLKEHRVARLGDPYRDQFSQAFGNRLSRIAVPEPMRYTGL